MSFKAYSTYFRRVFSCLQAHIIVSPILFQGLRKCILPQSNTAVTLLLPEWADNVHPSQQNDGEMDPWLNLISEELLLELISARILVA